MVFIALLATIAGQAEPRVLTVLEGPEFARLGIVAEVVERPAGVTDEQFAQHLIEAAGLQPWNGKQLNLPTKEGGGGIKAVHTWDGRAIRIRYIEGDIRRPGRVCRIRFEKGGPSDAREKAQRWCDLALGLSVHEGPRPPTITTTRLNLAWAEFSRRPLGNSVRPAIDKVEIGSLGRDRSSGKLRYWLRYTRTQAGSQTVRWADSAACPAVQPMLEGMRKLGPPYPAPHGVGDYGPSEVVLDGVGYFLRTPAMFSGLRQTGELTMRSNVGTPLAHWVEQSLELLDDCWAVQPPRSSD